MVIEEFGTLEGVNITYTVDPVTRRVQYCFTRK